ncbi:hypothetical protein [Prosthecobacter sp.]|uniref:hypothetical protein n=1 Tax=Prosthecobacter sp. TaxID=1965333 RepID=UPI0037850CD7
MILAVVFFIVIPMLKAFWAFITREPEPPKDLTDLQREISVEEFNDPENAGRKKWEGEFPRFFAIETRGGGVRFYRPEDMVKEVRAAIMDGSHPAHANAHTRWKDAEGKWHQTTQSVAEFARSAFKLNVLYRPSWSHAMAGLKWGMLIGICLKLLDTAASLAVVAPGAALCFLIAIGVCFIPRVGVVGVIVATVVMRQFYQGNFIMIAFVSALTGAVLGCLPGMTLGGLIGWARRSRLPLAPDAEPEGGALALKTILLPFAGGAAVIALYLLVFNPWAMAQLSE